VIIDEKVLGLYETAKALKCVGLHSRMRYPDAPATMCMGSATLL
jgi:hypothetical protein